MNTTPPEKNTDGYTLTLQLSQVLELLKEFRTEFMRWATVESEGEFPSAFLGFDNKELTGAAGILQLNSHSQTGKISCRFKPQSGGEELSWTHYETGYDLSEYERLIFSTWSYDTGFALDRNERSMAEWFIEDQSIADRLEGIAKRIDELLNTITMPRNSLFSAAIARLVIRDKRPKWKPCRVHWYYIQELDEVVSKLEYTLTKLSASVEIERLIKPTTKDLLESIRKACAEVEKLTEVDVNLDKVTNEEINFAEAAVIAYLTKRFGEQDDALGNWPRDWYECPEAFDLYKQKIKEYRAVKAKASLEEAKRMAEVQPTQKIIPEKPPEHEQIETFDDLYCMLGIDLQEYGCVLGQTLNAAIIAGPGIRRKYTAKGFSLPEMPENPRATKLMDWCTTCEQIIRASKPEPEEKDKKPIKKLKAKTWKQITIEVIDDDTLKYKISDRKWERANYTQMGFLDKRSNRPLKLWPIFLGLASKNLPPNIKRPGMNQKDIQRIRNILIAFFGIEESPIEYDRNTKEYQCKFRFNDPRDWPSISQNETLTD